MASVQSIEGAIFCSQIFVKNLVGRREKGGRKMRLWPKGRWKNLKMEVGEGSADRHRPFILTLERHEMLDCACVQRVQWGLEVGGGVRWGQGEPAPAPSPSATRSPHILLQSG